MATIIAEVRHNQIDGLWVPPVSGPCSRIAIPPTSPVWSAGSFKKVHIYINAPTIGAELHLPFAATGHGHREGGTAALDAFFDGR